MAEIIEINDFSDSRLDVFARLTEVQLRSKIEPKKGIFIAESPKVIHRALDAGCEPVAMLTVRRHIQGQAAEVIARCPEDMPLYTGDEELLSQLTGYPLTRGVLCAFKRPKQLKAEDLLKNASRVAVLENIVDHTNLGAIFRSAAALNMDAVLLTPSCCDPLYRRSVRVSMGTVFQIPWARIGEKPEDWPEAGVDMLHEAGFVTVATALRNDTVDIDDKRLSAEPRLAVVLGTEGDGLAETTIASCDYTVRIPMAHNVDSLNVAAASAVAFWELRKK